MEKSRHVIVKEMYRMNVKWQRRSEVSVVSIRHGGNWLAGVSRQEQTGGSYARYKVNKIGWGNGSVGQTGQKRVRSTRVKEDSWT